MEVEESPNNYLYTDLTVKKIDTVFRRSILPHLQIKFNFFFKFKTVFCIESHEYSSTSRYTAFAAVTVRDRPVSYDAIRRAVGRAVTVAALPDQQYRHDLIEMACLTVGNLLCTGRIPTYTNLLVQFHTRVERLMIRYGDGGDGMVPAAESAVGWLEKVHVEARSACTCCICLEKMGRRRRVLRMPCSHDFHGGCIEKWLRTSHYCPVCRYEMPTE